MPRVYSATGSKDNATATAGDILEMTAATGGMFEVLSAQFGTYDDSGEFEQLLIGWYRVSSSGSTGQSAPVVFKHDADDGSASTTLESFNTSIAATTGSGSLGTVTHSQAGYEYIPIPEERFRCRDGQGVVAKFVELPATDKNVFWRVTWIEEGA